MVCTFARGRMACMVRLLEAGSFPEKSAEEATHERIAIQTIYKQLCDADEPNLLEEKDMRVFDSRPSGDPLHLVCCNDCGKPVKASQFAAHAERCRSIISKEDAALELDTGTDRKKPLRKGRRIQTTNGELPDHDVNLSNQGREKPKSEPAGGDNDAVSELNLDNQNGMYHTLSGESQRMTTPVGHGAVPDASAVRNGVSGMPGPLATKIYHVQGSHRLRIALGHLYQQASVKEHGNDSVFVQHHQDNALSSRVPYGNQSLHEIHGESVSQTKF